MGELQRIKTFSRVFKSSSDVSIIAASQAVAGAGNLTLTSDIGPYTYSGFSIGHTVVVKFFSTPETDTITVNGIDMNGNVISRIFSTAAGGGAALVRLGTVFNSITSCVSSGAMTGNISVGLGNATVFGQPTGTYIEAVHFMHNAELNAILYTFTDETGDAQADDMLMQFGINLGSILTTKSWKFKNHLHSSKWFAIEDNQGLDFGVVVNYF